MYHYAKKDASKLREAAGQKYGKNDSPNNYPISGGICEHWPREVSDEICRKEQDANAWAGLAFAWHLYQGKRHHTFVMG